MAHPGAYRGTKRQKELKRLQKQEEKRLKRLNKQPDGSPDDGVPEFPLDGPILPEGATPEEPEASDAEPALEPAAGPPAGPPPEPSPEPSKDTDKTP